MVRVSGGMFVIVASNLAQTCVCPMFRQKGTSLPSVLFDIMRVAGISL